MEVIWGSDGGQLDVKQTSDGCRMGVGWVLGGGNWVSDGCRMGVGRVSDGCRVGIGCVSDVFQMRVRCMPDACRMHVRCAWGSTTMRLWCAPPQPPLVCPIRSCIIPIYGHTIMCYAHIWPYRVTPPATPMRHGRHHHYDDHCDGHRHHHHHASIHKRGHMIMHYTHIWPYEHALYPCMVM